MDIRNTEPSRLFRATGGGAGLNFDHPCAHGSPAVSLYLVSEQNDTTEDIGILIPVCVAPGLFGAVVAFVEACHGQAAGEEFLEDLLAGKGRTARLLESRRVQHEGAQRACCEAGFFTQGREHTCQPSTESPS